jgi:hypothetical protein
VKEKPANAYPPGGKEENNAEVNFVEVLKNADGTHLVAL